MSSHPYHEQVDIMNTVKLRELMEGLPEYTRIYFRGIVTISTRLSWLARR